jgi:hypothetical protein
MECSELKISLRKDTRVKHQPGAAGPSLPANSRPGIISVHTAALALFATHLEKIASEN